jgi:hypothetical protein
MAIYGQSGSGKTTLWATFPKPILVLICSGITEAGELRSVNTEEYRDVIHPLYLHDTDDIRKVVDELNQDNPYATVVADHATGIQDFTLKEILGLSSIPSQKGWGIATQQQWGQCTLQTKELLRGLLGLKSNVVIVAQERSFGDDNNSDTIKPVIGAALTPGAASWLNSTVDYIGQMFKRQKSEEVSTKIGDKVMKTRKMVTGVDYCLRTAPDSVYTTKFRVPRSFSVPDVIVDPTYEKIIEVISGTYEG